MGFNSVYRVLQDVFPQVDSRILRAVAIENSKDADVAVEVVLAEVMPSLSVQSGSVTPYPYKDVQVYNSADGTYSAAVNYGVFDEVIGEQVLSSKPGESSKVEFDLSCVNSHASSPNNGANEVHDQVFVDASDDFGENISSPRRHQVTSTEEGPEHSLLPKRRNNYTDGFVNSSSLHEEEQSSLDELVRKNHRSVTLVADVDPSAVEIISPNNIENQHVAEAVSPVTEVEEPEADVPSLTISGGDVSSNEMVHCGNVDMLNIVSDLSTKDLEKLEPSDVNSLVASEMDDLEDETSMKASSRSGQMCTTELLEDIIENEKSEKIALRLAKDLLLSFINEVEMKEKSVEKAREEAAHGGLDTFARVEDLKKMLRRAKEANDMHAGEVYGEKAILATEMRELQSRLHSLSEERVRALAILDEIRQALEVRLVSAEKEIKEAENAKLKKEESSLKYLAHEESSLEKVVQESKILEQQAKENSKLREFLIDRGRLVDMLQGEISVICQDVKLMKAKFEQGIPLNKSLSFSQTTTISTFSNSSVLAASEKVPEVVTFPDNQKASLSIPTDDQLLCGNAIPSTNKEFVDIDWELFDD